MALLKCPECSSEISDLATSCPQCGFPLSDDKIKTRIAIPAIPKEIWEGLQKASFGYPFLKWNVQNGDWVDENQLLATYNVKSFQARHFARGKIWTEAKILSPISGKIAGIKSIEYAKWDWSKLTTGSQSWFWSNDEDNEVNLTDEKTIAYVETPKEINYSPKAYSVYESIIDYGYFARARVDRTLFKKSSFEESDFPLSSLEGLANTYLRIEKLNI